MEYTPLSDFDDEKGVWESVTTPGIRQERQRQDIMASVEARAMRPQHSSGNTTKADLLGWTVGGVAARIPYPS